MAQRLTLAGWTGHSWGLAVGDGGNWSVLGRVLVGAMFEVSSALIAVHGLDLVGYSDLFLFPSSFHYY